MADIKKPLNELTFDIRKATRDKAEENINKALEAMGLQPITEKRIKATVSGGGYTPGQTFVLTGEVQIVPIEGTTNWFLGAVTETGEKITLKALIPQNPAGYTSDNTAVFIQETKPNEEKPEELHPTFDAPKAPSEIYKESLETLVHGTKSDVELYGLIKANIWPCKGLRLTYYGKVMRQSKARKDFTFGTTEVKAGSKRVSYISVWLVQK